MPKVHSEMIENTLYIRLSDFNGDCVSGMERAVEMGTQEQAKGIVVDLRNNPGGDLNNVVKISDMFLGEGTILTIRSRDGQVDTYTSDAEAVGLPLVVLVNEGSASASEVFSGAVQDHEAGVLIGERTYGKGIVQTYFPLKVRGGHLRITTSAYYTPNGRSIHEVGLTPDKIISLPAQFDGMPVSGIPHEEDSQLQAGLSVLQEQY